MIMKIRCIISLAAFAATLACSEAWAWDQDPAAQYFERKDTIVSGAGDARNVNAATHIIDPWPRYVGDRRIPANGERMSGAVERYRKNTPWVTPCPITPTFDIQTQGIFVFTGKGCANSAATAGTGAAPAGTGFGIGGTAATGAAPGGGTGFGIGAPVGTGFGIGPR
jgi:hypothetical protein